MRIQWAEMAQLGRNNFRLFSHTHSTSYKILYICSRLSKYTREFSSFAVVQIPFCRTKFSGLIPGKRSEAVEIQILKYFVSVVRMLKAQQPFPCSLEFADLEKQLYKMYINYKRIKIIFEMVEFPESGNMDVSKNTACQSSFVRSESQLKLKTFLQTRKRWQLFHLA